MKICTIIARNYVAFARVLARSFAEVHPDWTCSVLVVDDPSGYIDAAEEPFELLTIDQIGLPDVERMAAAYDIMELSTAVKPWLLRTLLEGAGDEPVAYLDPDIRVFSSLAEIDRRARQHDVVLTPHFTAPLPRDSRKPSEEDILVSGTYNLGFIALAPGATATELLDWWSERLENHCLNEPEKGRFVDQRWIDLAPGLWPGIDVLRDTSYNIAYWNLPTRSLADDGHGGYLVDGEPLHFFHFSGFDARDPTVLSKHQDRVEVSANPALVRICREYADELLANGFAEARDWPYGWAEMPNGIKLDRASRRVYREAVELGAITSPPFSQPGADLLAEYLQQGDGGGQATAGVNRYVKALWDSRPDFRRAFSTVESEGGPAFAGWLNDTAPRTGVAVDLLPGTAGVLPPDPPPPRPENGINVVGYLSSKRGVGEVARQLTAALRQGGVPVAEIDAPTVPEEIAPALSRLQDEQYPYDFNLICVNADMLPIVANGLGRRFFDRRNSAGLWFWEVADFPHVMRGAFDYVDEVWAATEFIAETLRPLSDTPVHTVRAPIVPGAVDEVAREQMGMPAGFCFLFLFDYRSVFRRKNPLGLVEAFCKAFEPGAGPSLVIKSICGDEFPAEREALAAAVRDRPEIHLAEDSVPAGIKNAMIAGCDCYVSLHRSEGLGLTMGEAMYFGKPTIATAYSGNLDFMTAENSFLVPCEMAPIGPDADPYPADAEWAEPDLDRAAELMRQVYENQEEAALRGRRAAADIRRTHSPAAARESIQEVIADGRRERLLTRLRPAVDAGTRAGIPSKRDLLEHLLTFSEPPPSEGAGKLKASAKRLYMRLLRPYSSHQQRINESLAGSLDEVRKALTELLRIEAEAEERFERRLSESDEAKPSK